MASRALRVFYRVKPLIPRRVQVGARRARARRIWRRLSRVPLPPIPRDHLGYPWPEGFAAGVVVTHDVETLVGQRNIPALLEVESEFGLHSCWNFVVRRYEVDASLIADLRQAGHEVGVHGVYHDGRKFDSEATFRARLAIMEAAARSWGADGFRSPSLLYKRDLLEEVPFGWDSSMPAWDPFQPQPPGCMRFVPFMLNRRCVELPVTLWQDFTLFEELSMPDIAVWRQQIEFLYLIGGLINVIVHPDYMLTKERLDLYRQLLATLRDLDNAWISLPGRVAEWERDRRGRTRP